MRRWLYLVGSLDEGEQYQGDRKSHLDLVIEGEGTCGQEILSYRAPLRFVDKSIGGEPVTFVISSQVHRNFNFGPRFVDLLHL